MDTAKVANQNIVNEDPDVVVTGKVVGNRCTSGFIRMPAILLQEAGAHGHTKVVVDDLIR